MENRSHGRDLQAPIYPLPDRSVEGNPSLIAECGFRIAGCGIRMGRGDFSRPLLGNTAQELISSVMKP